MILREPMILVTGATGHVGSELVTQLVDRRYPVRALTRRPEAVTFPAGVDVVRGDFDDPASIESALLGVDRLFLMSTQFLGNASSPTHAELVMDAARRAGVGHVVYLSTLAGGDAAGDPISRWHDRAETIVMGSGAAWTLLRPGRFMSNALQWAPMIRRGGEVFVPFADRALASIDPGDVAAVALVALTEPGHAGKAYGLSGPEALTPAQELRIIGTVLGRSLEPVPLPDEAARAGLHRSGMPAEVIDAIFARMGTGDHGADVLSAVRDVTGRTPKTFEAWARAHVDAFR